jgi:uncharacterized protein involved in response to NO
VVARTLPLAGERPEPTSRHGLAFAAKGFRPFFLLAALFAIAIVPSWLLILRGVLPVGSYLDPVAWHAHEMVFGFVVAVIAGFLLTAVGNWTQRETLTGAPLLALSALWLLGRVAMISAARLPRAVPALVDLAFLPLLIVVLARPLIASKNYRNLVMLAILGALFLANLVMHLQGLAVLPVGFARRAGLVGIDVVLLIILIIAGRVFPMFTRNATRVTSIRSNVKLDVATVAAMAVLTLLDAFFAGPRLAACVAGVAGVLAAARALHWGAQHSLRQPLLWILHAGYGWLVLGLLLRAVGTLDLAVSGSLATHALTVGAVGSLTLGMMARVALGHTGRPLIVSPAMAWGFAAINGAGIARTLAPLVAGNWYFSTLVAAGALWTLAFVLFVVVYAPVLTKPRIDGEAG